MLITAALGFSGLIAWLQGRALVGLGSDHHVHLFLVNVIRENGRRLFTHIPRMLNPAYCSAYPLFLHWCLSFFRNEQLPAVARWYNPLINLAVVGFAWVAVQGSGDTAALAGGVALLYATTPQFFHANSARNYGLTARPFGLLSFAVFSWCAIRLSDGRLEAGWLLGALASGYCVWGFNTFAAQAVVLCGLLLGIALGRWEVLACGGASLAIFLALHPSYGTSYLVNTLRFSRAYATELAELFILKRRPSIWRDLVWDIWRQVARNWRHGLSYAYTNAVIIVVFLNPLTLLSAWLVWSPGDAPTLVCRCAELSLAGLGVGLLTSFRPTRFLGEPERYVEMVSLASAVTGGWWLVQQFGATGLFVAAGYHLVCNLLQLGIGWMTRQHISDNRAQWRAVTAVIEDKLGREPVRFASNNEEIIKWFMDRPWQFARLNSADQDYAGFTAGQVIAQWPCVRQGPFTALVRMYRINVCLLDRKNFEGLDWAAGEARPVNEAVLFENERLRVLRLDWPNTVSVRPKSKTSAEYEYTKPKS